jgi:Base plate wedge protein 53
MADNFFKHYPIVEYSVGNSNTAIRNILAKVAFQKDNDYNFYTYHPYTIVEGDRADMLAYLYYGDPGYDWVIYYSNMIVDPYFDWPLDTNSFKRFIETKYGSLSDARSKIKFYRSNYLSDDSTLSTTAYNALSELQKSFWSPVIGNNNSIINYRRKKDDVVFNTNKTISLNISTVGTKVYSVGEQVRQSSGSVVVASGSLKFSNSSVAVVDNIEGSFTTSYNLVGVSSGANSTVSSVDVISTSIDPTVQNYFVPVTYYEYEEELNEKRKNIRLLDSSYVGKVEEQLKDLLSL